MKKAVLMVMALLSASVNAATLSVGNNIELLVVDGKAVEAEGWSEVKSIELSDGKHQVVVRFDGDLKRGSKNTRFTTRPYLFDINVDKQDAEIILPRLTTESQAKAHFTRGPEWALVLANGSKEALPAVELHGDGFGAYNDMPALVASYNRKNGIMVENGNAVDLQEVAVVVDDKTGKVEITGDALTQLKMWYTKATNKEKKAFKIWMAEYDFN